jgi:CheY-like chemotaxis protein
MQQPVTAQTRTPESDGICRRKLCLAKEQLLVGGAIVAGAAASTALTSSAYVPEQATGIVLSGMFSAAGLAHCSGHHITAYYYLADAGYRVVGATGGQAGLEKARQLQPSVITLDIILPDVDGWQVLHQLKADPATRDIPVVALTVVDQEHLGRRLGAAAYIVKPFERAQLVDTLERVAPCGRRLLVVDDDPDVPDLVRQLLEGTGFAIEAAEDGLAALRALALHRPDAILLDLLMPQMDGFDVIRRLRADAERRDIPVIVLTAKVLTRKERRLLRKHALAIIEKDGLDRTALIDQLKQIIPDATCLTSNHTAA